MEEAKSVTFFDGGGGENSRRWRGKVSARVSKARAEQVWSLFEDFFGVSKWFPGITSSVGVEGRNGEVGCIRRVVFAPEEEGAENAEEEQWCTERLVAMDGGERRLSYEIVESNIGYNSYIATFKVTKDEESMDNTKIEWSFEVDPPVQGINNVAEMEKMFEAELQSAAITMADSCQIII